MPSFSFEELSYENALLHAIQRRNAQVGAMREMVTPELVDRVVNLAQNHGSYLQPGTILSLAQSGMSDSPDVVQQVAEREAQRELREGGFWNNLGRMVSAPFRTKVGRAVTAPFRSDPFKGGVRRAFTAADMLWEEGISRPLRFAMQMEAEQGGSFGTLATPLTPDNPITGFLADRNVPGFRGATGEPSEEFQAVLDRGEREGGGIGRGVQAARQTLLDNYRRTGRSAGLIALRQMAGTEEGEADLGSGYLPAGRTGALSRAEREGPEAIPGLARQFEEQPEFVKRLEQAAQHTYLHNGKPLSMGRFAAGEVFEADTRAYNLTSGLIDAAVLVGADPASRVGSAVSRSRALNQCR